MHPSPTDKAASAPGTDMRHTHIRSFVLRQGRVSAAQQRFYEEGMPRWGIPYQPALLDLAAVFGRAVSPAPTFLEIGCGMGETTAVIAAAHPQGGDVVVVAHKGTIRAALHHAAGIDLKDTLRLSIDPLSITIVEYANARWTLRRMNMTP